MSAAADERPDQPQKPDYEVGYGKPPKHTQFKKGQKRRAKSQPRSRPNPYAILRKELKRSVKVNIDGGDERISVQRALFLRLRQRAVQGAPWAQKMVMQITKELPDDNFVQPWIEVQAYVFRLRKQLEWKIGQGTREPESKDDE